MPAKKKGTSNKMKLFGIIIIGALIVSYGGILLSPDNKIPSPNPASFREELWMTFIPENASEFRFLNITSLYSFPGIITNNTLLSVNQPEFSINISDLNYDVDIITSNGGLVSVLGMNSSLIDYIGTSLAFSNLTTLDYNGVPLFQVFLGNSTSPTEAWMSIHNGALLYCVGNNIAINSLKAVIDSIASNFFKNDSYKIGYLIASNNETCYAFSYYSESTNIFEIIWDMRAAYGVTEITKRDVFFFASGDSASSKYSKVVSELIPKAASAYLGDEFILSVQKFASQDIRTVLMNI